MDQTAKINILTERNLLYTVDFLWLDAVGHFNVRWTIHYLGSFP